MFYPTKPGSAELHQKLKGYSYAKMSCPVNFLRDYRLILEENSNNDAAKIKSQVMNFIDPIRRHNASSGRVVYPNRRASIDGHKLYSAQAIMPYDPPSGRRRGDSSHEHRNHSSLSSFKNSSECENSELASSESASIEANENESALQYSSAARIQEL